MNFGKQSLYKSTLTYLTSVYSAPPKGNVLRRLQTLCLMLCSCIETKSSSLEGISRCFSEQSESASEISDKQSESRIKQAKRWLSSKWTDWDTFYAPYIKPLLKKLAKKGEIIIIIDGSETAGDCVTLMISVLWRGYAVPLTWITRKGKKGHFPEDMHLELVRFAKDILPPDCRIVLLGDGEFDGLRLRTRCREYRWEFVLRTSKDRIIDCGGEKARFDSLCPDPNSDFVFVEKAVDGDNAVMHHDKTCQDPIFLLTDMELGQMACAYYKRRFKIEMLFKHMKSHGFNLQKSKVCSAHRVSNLIIIVALAFLLTFCAGLWLKTQSKEVLSKITRPDRVPKMSPVILANRCRQSDRIVFNNIFSLFSKNCDDFFNIIA